MNVKYTKFQDLSLEEKKEVLKKEHKEFLEEFDSLQTPLSNFYMLVFFVLLVRYFVKKFYVKVF